MAVRVGLLREAGADDVLVIPFDRDLANWSPERFVEEIIVGTLHAKAVVVGANFRFGHKAGGDVAPHNLAAIVQVFQDQLLDQRLRDPCIG